jgi:hypothetical protein
LLVFAGVSAILMLFLAGIGSVASDVIRTRYAYGFSHWLRSRLLHAYAGQLTLTSLRGTPRKCISDCRISPTSPIMC